MSARDSGSPEPSTDRGDVSSPPDTPRTAPSAEAPSPERSKAVPGAVSGAQSVEVVLSDTPVSRNTAPPATEETAPAGPDLTPPVVRDRRSELGPRASIDTLLSAPVPADRFEVHFEDRMDELTTRVQALEQRLRRLELASETPEHEPRQVPGWIWVAFLVALALVAALMRLSR